jgi:hypothetical protein
MSPLAMAAAFCSLKLRTYWLNAEHNSSFVIVNSGTEIPEPVIAMALLMGAS